MDIGIFIEYSGQVVQIPVNPQTFTVNTEGNNAVTEIITLGEIIVPKKKKLSSISWESFFPYESWYPAIRTSGSFKSADFYLSFLDKIRDECKPCRLTVTGIGFDSEVVIESFEYYHQAGDHEDTYYSINFKTYRPYTVSVISKVGTFNKPKNTVATPTPKQVTIGCTVILNGAVHYDSYGSKPGKSFTNYKCVVKLINKKGSHPYCVYTPSGGQLGWVTKESVVIA